MKHFFGEPIEQVIGEPVEEIKQNIFGFIPANDEKAYNHEEGSKAVADVMTAGWGVRALVVRKDCTTPTNAFNWGIVVRLNSTLRDGKPKPIGCTFFNGGSTIHYFTQDELIMLTKPMTHLDVENIIERGGNK